MSTLTLGTRVRLKDRYLDEAMARPVTGTIRDMFRRPDWGNAMAFVVMVDHDLPMLPPGGEFTADCLVARAESLEDAG